MAYHQGFSSKLRDDLCAQNKYLSESVAPFEYTTYDGKFENCGRCVYDHYTRPFDADIIDVDSELRNQTRPASKCPSRKYDSNCKKSSNCISTYDDDVPVVLAPEVCPIVFNNLNWGSDTGIRDPKPSNCKGFVVGKKMPHMYNDSKKSNSKQSNSNQSNKNNMNYDSWDNSFETYGYY